MEQNEKDLKKEGDSGNPKENLSPRHLSELIAGEVYYFFNMKLCLFNLQLEDPDQYKVIVEVFQDIKKERLQLKG